VRNNLFHGGKEKAERWPGHDTELLSVGLEILLAAACVDPAIKSQFRRE
jgi:hypothetical protein